MGFIDDLKHAVDNYETDDCQTEIVDFAIIGDGTVLNVGETFRFKVRVSNQGNLNMKKVKVQVLGTSYADVTSSGGPFSGGVTWAFSGSAISSAFNLDAHQSHTTGYFKGKTKAVTSGAKDIVTARIYSWDASLEHILKDHTGAGVAEGKLNREIAPD